MTMTKRIASVTTEVLPSGVTITTFHLTPRGRADLSMDGGGRELVQPSLPETRGARELVQQALAETNRASRRAALLCAIPVAVVGAALCLVGAPWLVVVGSQWITTLIAFRVWKSRYQRQEACEDRSK